MLITFFLIVRIPQLTIIGWITSHAMGSNVLPTDKKSDMPSGLAVLSPEALTGTVLFVVLLLGLAGNKMDDIPDRRSVPAFS